MVSAAWAVSTGRESVLGVLAKVAGAALRRSGRRIGDVLLVALRLLLVVAGLGAVTIGAWTASHVAGWIVGGASLLIIEWAVKRR